MKAYVQIKLASCGALPNSTQKSFMLALVDPLLKSHLEQQHTLLESGGGLCPADQRIQNFLNDYLSGLGEAVPKLPSRQLKLERHGVAKLLSLPKNGDVFKNNIITSYRVAQVDREHPSVCILSCLESSNFLCI